MKIIAFNGPPRCGKDTCANLMVDYVTNRTDRPVFKRALSMPLRLMAFGALQKQYDEHEFERLKDQVIPSLGVTMRQFQIGLSERFMKPFYRSDIFPLLMRESIPVEARSRDCLVVISDCGFQLEVNSLSLFEGADNIAVCRVLRDGKNFNNDSRQWVHHIPDRDFEIENNSDLETLNQRVVELAETLNKAWDI